MPELVVEKYLNYPNPVHESNIGRLLGPDQQGRIFQIVSVDGCEATLQWRPGGPELPIPDDSRR